MSTDKGHSPPRFRGIFSPVTEETPNKQCRIFRIRFNDCYEAYGRPKGAEMCMAELADFDECITGRKEAFRVNEMRKERMRQFWSGQRKYSEIYAKPPPGGTYERPYEFPLV